MSSLTGPVTSTADAVLVSGVYGAGKSTLVADVGAYLEERGAHYGVLDVDWLDWFDVVGSDEDRMRIVMGNVASVARAYASAGVRHLALAWSVDTRERLDLLRDAARGEERLRAFGARRRHLDPHGRE